MQAINCANCANWQYKSDDYLDSQAKQAGFGRCKKAPMLDNIIEYNIDADKYILGESFKEVKMCVMDGSSYRAELYTMPDFSCSEHAPASTKSDDR